MTIFAISKTKNNITDMTTETYNKITNENGWLKDEIIIDLRKQISLNSLFFSDYENSYGIDSHQVCNFFDGFIDYISELMDEDDVSDEDFFKNLDKYDTTDNLLEWYGCFDENPFTLEAEDDE